MQKKSSQSFRNGGSRPGKSGSSRDRDKGYNKGAKSSGKNYDGRSSASGSSGEGAARQAKPYSGRITDSDKPKRSFDKPSFNRDERSPRKEFDKRGRNGDKPFGDKPKRSFDKPSFNREDKDTGRDERSPRKEFDKRGRNGDKPFGDRPKRSFDKPSFNREDKDTGRDEHRPRKEFDKRGRNGDKPFGDRPKRSFDKPSFNRDDKDTGRDERSPRKEFDKRGRNDDKPFGDRPKRSFDKPAFNREDKHTGGGERKSEGAFDKPSFNKEGKNKEGGKFKPRAEFDKSKKQSDSRPFRDRPKPVDRKGTPGKPAKKKVTDDTPELEQSSFGDVMNNAFKQPKKKKDGNEDTFRKPVVHEDKVFGALSDDVPEDLPKIPFKKKVNSAFRKKHVHDHSGGRKKKYIDDEDDGDDKEINQKDGARLEMPLNKFIAHSGECSRRDAAELVRQGKVKVNGELVLEPGYRVQHDDMVTMSGKKLTPQKGMVYILLNKPKGFITTNDDPQGRRTVMELVGNADVDRLFPVGRLDRNTSGLLLITNDGDLTQKLSHPAYEIKKVYHVTLDRPLTKADFDKVVAGVELEDGIAKVDALHFLDKKDELGLEIHSGRNRIVRRIFESLNYEVVKLDRVMYAGLTKKNLPRSKWRYLDEREVILLKHFKS